MSLNFLTSHRPPWVGSLRLLHELVQRNRWPWGLSGVFAGAMVWAIFANSSPVEYIGLQQLPGITDDVIAVQGELFRVEEPVCFNSETGMAVFVVEIVSSAGFEGKTHLTFGGDARSLSFFAKEVRLVNVGARRAKNVGVGAVAGVKGIVLGVLQLLSHPIDTITGLGSGAWALGGYIKDTPLIRIRQDVEELADAYYVNSACEVAEEHGLDFFELKTEHAKAVIYSEATFRIGGKAAIEVLTLLVPFSKVKYGGDAAKAGKAALAAAKAAEMVSLAAKMAKAGAVSGRTVKLAKASMFFPRMADKMAETLARLKHAATPRTFKPPTAKLGHAASLDYKATFFAKFPHLKGKVVVHHSIEQQVFTRYPNILGKAELHSLENLRGIPKLLDGKLHKSQIRREWDTFYRSNPASTMTKQKLLDKATEIDRIFGNQFNPPLF